MYAFGGHPIRVGSGSLYLQLVSDVKLLDPLTIGFGVSSKYTFNNQLLRGLSNTIHHPSNLSVDVCPYNTLSNIVII